jgi:predicted amidophosphoribosyltransferase
MSLLVPCQVCGQKISFMAEVCPHCSHPSHSVISERVVALGRLERALDDDEAITRRKHQRLSGLIVDACE